MKNLLIRLWTNLVHLGVHVDLAESQKIKIKLLNKLGIVGVLASLALILIIRVYLGIGSTIGSLGTIILILLAMYFQYLRKYHITQHFLCILYPAYIAYRINVSGQSTAQLSILLIVVLMIFILYEERPKLKMISFAYVLMIVLGSHIFRIIEPNQFAFDETYFTQISVFISTLLVLGSIIFIYQQDVIKYENSNNLLIDELKNKSEELERFAYVTSHDLKEPVRNIGSLAKILQMNNEESGHAVKNIEIINLIEGSSNRMSSLIDSILDFSKIDMQEFYSEEVSIAEIIQEFISSHNQFIVDKNANIETANLPVLSGNRVFLSLLFQNLLKNSITYNNSKIPSVSISGGERLKTVEIVISDNGIGIDEQYYEYIFEPFKKLGNEMMFQGSGLGLSICKKVVEYHGGSISVISNIGYGTKFIINLPRNKK